MSALPTPMRPEIARLDRCVSRQYLRRTLARDGAAIIERLLPPRTLDRLSHELAPWFARARAGEGPFFGRATRRFSALFERAPVTAELALWPGLFEPLEALLLGPDRAHADCIQINLTQAIGIDPGEPAQALHRDDAMFPVTPGHELMVNVMWTVDAFTAENGATRIIPGSHRWPASRRGEDAETCAAAAPAGSAIIWLGATWHGGGANLTAACRRGVVISYSLGWLAQAEKLLLSLSSECVRNLPARLQALIGYQVHRPNLGWVEGRDPREWLNGRFDGLAAASDNMTPEMQARIEARLAGRADPVIP